MTARPLVLPELGAAPALARTEALAAACREAHAAGHAEGLAEGRRQAEAESTAMRAELSAALADLRFTRAEAAIGVMESLRPLLEGLVTRVFPGLRCEAFLAQALALAERHVAAGAAMRLRVAPGLLAGFAALGRPGTRLANESRAPVGDPPEGEAADWPATWPIPVADPMLPAGRAILEAGAEGQWEIDFDELLASLATAVEEFFITLKERQDD